MKVHGVPFALVVLLFSSANTVCADVKDIRMEKLPPDVRGAKAYADVLNVEPMVKQWSDQWHYDVAKTTVAIGLKQALEDLQKAMVSAPTNEELLLLTGLTAHYAYNLDVDFRS